MRDAPTTAARMRPDLRIGLIQYPGAKVHDAFRAFEIAAARRNLAVERIVVHAAATVGTTARQHAEPDFSGFDNLGLLVVPCDFARVYGPDGRDTLLILHRAIRETVMVLLIAATPREARCAQMLLQPLSTWSPGAFWEEFRPGADPVDTRFIADGSLLWAIGPAAAVDAAARIGLLVPGT